jgi:hypothetical protein
MGAGCTPLPAENSFAWTAGGGLDFNLRRHLAIRIIQAEYLMTRFQDYSSGKTTEQDDVRLSAGLVFRFGGNPAPPLPPPSPLTYSCSVNPTSVFPGETIAASGTALNLNPAKTAVYTWSVDGGTVTGVSSTATIDTTNIAAGAYTLKCHVSEGDKPGENADATAPYAVKAYEPPTVSCTANPNNVLSGESSTITAIGVSPQNRPLTYSYSSTSGSVSGTGTTATLSTVGAAVGPVTVTCNVVDDKGQTASGTTAVTVALNLQRNPDAQLAVVGNASGQETGSHKLATERAVNTKTYLVSEKGIDAPRIAVYTGSQDGKVVSMTLIPAGATFDSTGDKPVQ